MEDISSGTIEEEWTSNQERKVVKRELFRMAMEGKWDEVAELYEQDEWAQTAKITNSGETALHIAISVGKEDNVGQLIQSIRDPFRLRQVLETRNYRGNTPLHSAASMGNVAMCQCIATVYPELVGATNNNGDTPFVLAALQGEKAAFFCLHFICLDKDMDGYRFSWRKNGDTILHCAIAGDYFDLAFQIIHLYPKLARSVNQKGLTPLHLLASNPSAFRSGSHLGGYYKINYHCILVDPLEVEASSKQPERTDSPRDKKNLNPEKFRACNDLLQLFWRMVQGVTKTERKCREKADAENPGPKAGRPEFPSDDQPMRRISPGNKKTPAYPENYRTCNDFFKLLWKMVLVVTGTNRVKTDAENTEVPKARTHGIDELFPANYRTCIEFVKLANKALLMFLGILGLSTTAITKMESNKRKHVWAVQVMNELLRLNSTYKDASISDLNELLRLNSTYEDASIDGDHARDSAQSRTKEFERPYDLTASGARMGHSSQDGMEKLETPILLAAKNGITEIVERILEVYPIAIYDVNADNKNIVLLAVEYRQPKVYELVRRKNISTESCMFRQLDNEGNSALHLAAKFRENTPWRISSNAALQMRCENIWYEYVRDSMPSNFFPEPNEERKTPSDLFTESHIKLAKDGNKWLNITSDACAFFSGLVVTVVFATSTTVPGGFKESGIPALQNMPGFDLFAISSLVALCSSIISLVVFLPIVASRYQVRDFGKILLLKLMLGLTSITVSIYAMLISFCTGHFLVLRKELRSMAVPMYVIAYLSILLFTLTQLPFYFDLLRATYLSVPQRK